MTFGIKKYCILIIFAGAIKSDTKNKQVLDKLQVERERGITVKAQTASVIYRYEGKVCIFLNVCAVVMWQYQVRHVHYYTSCIERNSNVI